MRGRHCGKQFSGSVNYYNIQFITTLIIISFSSGLDSAIIIVNATNVESSIFFCHLQIMRHFYQENREFITTLIIISFSSGLDSAIIIVNATNVESSIFFCHLQIMRHFYQENRETQLQLFACSRQKSCGSLLRNTKDLPLFLPVIHKSLSHQKIDKYCRYFL